MFMQKEKTLWSRFLVTLTSIVMLISVVMPDISAFADSGQTRGKVSDNKFDITDIVDVTNMTVKINGVTYDLTDDNVVLPRIQNGDKLSFAFNWEIPSEYMSADGMQDVLSKKVFHYIYRINEQFSGIKDLIGSSSKSNYTYTLSDGVIDIEINDETADAGTSHYGGNFEFDGTVESSGLDTDDFGDYKFEFFGQTFFAPSNDSLELDVEKSSGPIYLGDDGSYYVDFTVKGKCYGNCNPDKLNFKFEDLLGESYDKVIKWSDDVNFDSATNTFTLTDNSKIPHGDNEWSTSNAELFTYTVKLKNDVSFDTWGEGYEKRKNIITFKAYNETKEKTDTAECTPNLAQPEASKNGTFNKDDKTITWTITVKHGNYTDEQITITDTPSDNFDASALEELKNAFEAEGFTEKDGKFSATLDKLNKEHFKDNGDYVFTYTTNVSEDLIDQKEKKTVVNKIDVVFDDKDTPPVTKNSTASVVTSEGVGVSIDKEFSGIENGRLKWTATFDVPSYDEIGSDVTALTISDNTKDYYGYSDHKIIPETVVLTLNDGSSYKLLGNENLILDQWSQEWNTSEQYFYIKFDTNFIKKLIGHTVTLTYETEPMSGATLSNKFKNTVDISITYNGNSYNNSDVVTYEPTYLIEKSAANDVDVKEFTDGKLIPLVWAVSVNNIKSDWKEGDTVTVIDTLPKGCKIVDGSAFYVVVGSGSDGKPYLKWEKSNNRTQIEYTVNEDGTVTFTVVIDKDTADILNTDVDPNQLYTNNHLAVIYVTEMESESYDEIFDSVLAKLSETDNVYQAETVQFTNSADVIVTNGDDTLAEVDDVTATYNKSITVSNIVDKQTGALYQNNPDGNNALLMVQGYSIEFNKDRLKLIKGDNTDKILVATDKMGLKLALHENCNNHPLKITKINPDGTEEDVTSEDSIYEYDASTKRLIFNLDDQTYYKVTYYVDYKKLNVKDDEETDSTDNLYSNTVSLSGFGNYKISNNKALSFGDYHSYSEVHWDANVLGLQIQGTKVWKDKDSDGRPAFLNIKVAKYKITTVNGKNNYDLVGEPTVYNNNDSIIFGDDGNGTWYFIIDDLVAKDKDNKYAYKIEEIDIDGYTASYNSSSLNEDGYIVCDGDIGNVVTVSDFVITNTATSTPTPTPETTSLTVTKQWQFAGENAKSANSVQEGYEEEISFNLKKYDTSAVGTDMGISDPITKGTYLLKYSLVGDDEPTYNFIFKVDDKGKATALAGSQYVGISDNGNTIKVGKSIESMAMIQSVGRITVISGDGNGSSTSGVTINLDGVKKAELYKLEEVELVDAGKTGKLDKHICEFNDLPKFDEDTNEEILYTIEEDSIPDGYESIVGETEATVEGQKVTVVNKKSCKVKISKEDLGGNALSNASMKLEKSGDAGWTKIWVTDGTDKEFELGIGTYTLTETAAPEGYLTITKFNFEVKGENGDLVVELEKTSTNGEYDIKDDNTIVVKDKRSIVNISKESVGGKPVSDAELTLTAVKESGEGYVEDKTQTIIFSYLADDSGDETVYPTNDPTYVSEEDGEWVYKLTWKSGNAPSLIWLKEGTYTLKETTAPTGYLKTISTFTFTVTYDEGQLVITDLNTDTDGEYELNTSTKTITVKDEHDTVVKIGKYEASGIKEVVGAKMTLSAVNYNTTDNGLNATITPSDDKSIFDGDDKNDENQWSNSVTWESEETLKEFTLKSGKYMLKEETEPEGYIKLTTVFIFEVTTDGTVKRIAVYQSTKTENTYSSSTDYESDKKGYDFKPESSESEDNVIRVYNEVKLELNEVLISKMSVFGSGELEGAKLTLTTDDGNITVDGETKKSCEWVSGKDAKKFKLADGNYTLAETIKPDNYKELPTEVNFTVVDGEVASVELKDPQYLEDKDGDGVPETNEINKNFYVTQKDNHIIIKNEPVLTFSKKALCGTKELEGAGLQIKYNDEIIDSWTSGADEHELSTESVYKLYDIWEDNHDATFVLHEEAVPGGYKVATDIKFKFDENGNVVLVDVEATTGSVSNNVVTMFDAIIVKISKQDLGGSEIQDADMTLTALDDAKISGATQGEIAKDKKTLTWTSVKDTTNEVYLGVGDYTLTETTAPAGYKDLNTEIKFTVNDKGEVTINSTVQKIYNEPAVIVKNGNEVIVKNDLEEQDVLISKQDLNGNEVDGAKMKLTPDTSAGSTAGIVTKVTGEPDELSQAAVTWTSKKDEKAEFSLKPGKYTLEETTAPTGYIKLKTTIEFTVGNDGTVTVNNMNQITDAGEGEYVVANGSKLTIKNKLETTTEPEPTPSEPQPEQPKTVKVTINKVDVVGGEEVDGATLELFDKDGKSVGSWISESGKTHDFEGLTPDEQYTLRETITPDGYTTATDTVFTVDEDGKVTVVSGTDAVVDENGVLVINDTKKTDDSSSEGSDSSSDTDSSSEEQTDSSTADSSSTGSSLDQNTPSSSDGDSSDSRNTTTSSPNSTGSSSTNSKTTTSSGSTSSSGTATGNPNTGAAAAATSLLIAAAALAVVGKKKNDDDK